MWERAFYVNGEQRFQLQALTGTANGNFGSIQTISAVSEAPLGADLAFNTNGKALVVWSRYLPNDNSVVEGVVGP